MMAVASIYGILVRSLRTHQCHLSSLRIASGGMHVNRGLRRDFREVSGLSILPVWGSTETTGIALCHGRN
jgi:long-chain acyl-CoA synthetase